MRLYLTVYRKSCLLTPGLGVNCGMMDLIPDWKLEEVDSRNRGPVTPAAGPETHSLG